MLKEVLNQKQIELCEENQWDFSDLKALFINPYNHSGLKGLGFIILQIIKNNITSLISFCERKLKNHDP